jgi:hypothetical protein
VKKRGFIKTSTDVSLAELSFSSSIENPSRFLLNSLQKKQSPMEASPMLPAVEHIFKEDLGHDHALARQGTQTAGAEKDSIMTTYTNPRKDSFYSMQEVEDLEWEGGQMPHPHNWNIHYSTDLKYSLHPVTPSTLDTKKEELDFWMEICQGFLHLQTYVKKLMNVRTYSKRVENLSPFIHAQGETPSHSHHDSSYDKLFHKFTMQAQKLTQVHQSFL